MSYYGNQDYWLNVSQGNVAGMTHVNKFGRNSNIASGGQEEIWDGSAAYTYPATALMTSMSQTADQTAMRGTVCEVQGLDATWAAVTQDATLDASDTTTVVTLTTPLIRVFRVKVYGGPITSTVRIHNAGETVDYAVVSIGAQQTQMAIYTVPLGKTAYMTNYYAHVNPGTNLDPTSCQIRLWARDNANSYSKRVQHSVGITSGGFQHHFAPYPSFAAQTDIFMDGAPVGKAADITAGFDLVLIDD